MNIVTHIATAAVLAGCLFAPGVQAADYQVHMVAKDAFGRFAQFEPAFLKVQPGDTVTFVSAEFTDNSESIPALAPQGAEIWKGKLGENVTVTFDNEGFYAYKCLQYVGRGMVGLIQVGDNPAPLDTAAMEKLPNKAQMRLGVLLAKATGELEIAQR